MNCQMKNIILDTIGPFWIWILRRQLQGKEKQDCTFKEAIGLTQLIETVDIQEKKDMLNILLNLADERFNAEDWEEIGGSSMVVELSEGVQKRLEQMYLDQVRKEAKEEGREENNRFIISNCLSNGFSLDDISKITGLSLSKISQIADSLQ